MRSLGAKEIVELWSRCRHASRATRAIVLVESADPELDREQVLDLPLGQRDLRLIRLRRALIGDEMEVYATCPSCEGELEFSIDAAALEVVEMDGVADSDTSTFTIGLDAWKVDARLPTSRDLLALDACLEPERARRRLVEFCVGEVQRAGDDIDPSRLPDELVAKLAAELEERDPQADLVLDLDCPTCGHAWNRTFDIVSFLWREIDVLARRHLRDVHLIAGEYGWTEREILELDPFRRRCYVEMIES